MDYESFKRRFNIKLNEQQEAALTNVDGQTLLLAVPGSGKTTTLVCRVGYMIYVLGIDPSKILVITFTRAAAQDMRDRFASIFGIDYSNRIDFRTINSLCEYILNEYCRVRNHQKPRLLKDNYPVLSKMFQDIYGIYPAENDVKSMQLAITRVKNLQYTEEDIKAVQVDKRHLQPLYSAYQEYLNRSGQMDYDDQLVYAHSIITNDQECLDWLQKSYPYILVDEAQDTSKIQHVIINILATRHKHIFMVGDEDQSIYGFRAAYPDALMQFGETYPDAKILKLERNYRSTPEIIKVSNYFIRKNHNRYDKKMFTERESGNKVRFLKCTRREDQYRAIAKNLISRYEGVTAVIFRNNESAIPLIAEFMRDNIPFRCRGMDTVFFNSRVVIDLKNIMLSALDPYNYSLFWNTYYLFNAPVSKKAAYNATHTIDRSKHDSIWYTLYYGGDISINNRDRVKTIAKELAGIKKNNNARYAIDSICAAGYKRAEDDRVFILRTLADEGETIQDFLTRLDELERRIPHVSHDKRIPYIFTTVHSAKGLEYDNVIIIDEIDPLFPDGRSDIEEERRLFYVAMTRAKNNLMLLSYGDEKQPFIDSLEKYTTPKNSRRTSGTPRIPVKQNSKSMSMDRYKVGVRVSHKKYGTATIISIDNDVATVRFDRYGVKKYSISICAEQGIFKCI